MTKKFPSQNFDGFVTVQITITNLSQNCDGFVTVICHNFVTKIVSVTKLHHVKAFLSQNCDGIVTKIHHKIMTN